MPLLFLDETTSSVIVLALVAGLSLLMPVFADPKRTFHRVVLLSISAGLALRYAWWRATETVAPLGLTWDWAASWSLLPQECHLRLGKVSKIPLRYRVHPVRWLHHQNLS